MLISLYRNVHGRGREHRVIFDRDGIVIQRTTVFESESPSAEQRQTVIGENSLPSTDQLVFESVRNAILRGYVVFYGYIPSPTYPLTSSHIREFAGVALEPDHADGLPVWPDERRRRGSKPTYLLFTVLSSAAK